MTLMTLTAAAALDMPRLSDEEVSKLTPLIIEYIINNKDTIGSSGKIISIPQEWHKPNIQVLFSQLAIQQLGEKADWFQHMVFGSLGENYHFRPGKKLVGRPKLEFGDISELGKKFFSHNSDFLTICINDLTTYCNDNDIIHEALVQSLSFVFNEPIQGIDQRLSFFISFPHLLPKITIKLLESNKILLCSREDITPAQKENGFRSIDESLCHYAKDYTAHKQVMSRRTIGSDEDLRNKLLKLLSTHKMTLINAIDNLIDEDNEELKTFVSRVIFHRMMAIKKNNQFGDGKTISYDQTISDEYGSSSIVDMLDKELSKSHVNQRVESLDEKINRAEAVKIVIAENMIELNKIGMYIVSRLREINNESSFDRSFKLEAFLNAAGYKIIELICSDNECKDSSAFQGVAYRMKGSRISITPDGDLNWAKLISPIILTNTYNDMVETQINILKLRREKKTPSDIMRTTKKNKEFVMATLSLMSLLEEKLQDNESKVVSLNTIKNYLKVDDHGRVQIKNYFSHWWVQLLPIMLEKKNEYAVQARRDLLQLTGVHRYIINGIGWGREASRADNAVCEDGRRKSISELYYEAIFDEQGNVVPSDIMERVKEYQKNLIRPSFARA